MGMGFTTNMGMELASTLDHFNDAIKNAKKDTSGLRKELKIAEKEYKKIRTTADTVAAQVAQTRVNALAARVEASQTKVSSLFAQKSEAMRPSGPPSSHRIGGSAKAAEAHWIKRPALGAMKLGAHVTKFALGRNYSPEALVHDMLFSGMAVGKLGAGAESWVAERQKARAQKAESVEKLFKRIDQMPNSKKIYEALYAWSPASRMTAGDRAGRAVGRGLSKIAETGASVAAFGLNKGSAALGVVGGVVTKALPWAIIATSVADAATAYYDKSKTEAQKKDAVAQAANKLLGSSRNTRASVGILQEALQVLPTNTGKALQLVENAKREMSGKKKMGAPSLEAIRSEFKKDTSFLNNLLVDRSDSEIAQRRKQGWSDEQILAEQESGWVRGDIWKEARRKVIEQRQKSDDDIEKGKAAQIELANENPQYKAHEYTRDLRFSALDSDRRRGRMLSPTI